MAIAVKTTLQWLRRKKKQHYINSIQKEHGAHEKVEMSLSVKQKS